MYFPTLNQALESEDLQMTECQVIELIGSLNCDQGVRFTFENKAVNLYRMASGNYEITAYNVK